ncbi:hypothetical protein [Urechidicola croceus]|uniref:Uncharacterized protein n=1 Tax=Urechidicola croceus TaxID=1850246 RepID=A0A1D8P889_9FLAO|nr:hypothetical protein [Urechidicola croceus]AOW20784.1 hypothetical protein LPB138_08885 [Urechidicola croceus]
MDTKEYICEYCHEEFIPNRRFVQKYCCTNCRVKSYHRRNKKVSNNEIEDKTKKPKTKIEKMSIEGIGNSMAGTAAVEALKSLLTKDENKPATKKDIQRLEQKIERFHKVKNLSPNQNYEFPFFDMETGNIVYKGIFHS